ncbi:MAG: hypothetical protein KIT27_04415 [Legionellales bacterium]|nr:hypothetical protein [Legionellales bacterium]
MFSRINTALSTVRSQINNFVSFFSPSSVESSEFDPIEVWQRFQREIEARLKNQLHYSDDQIEFALDVFRHHILTWYENEGNYNPQRKPPRAVLNKALRECNVYFRNISPVMAEFHQGKIGLYEINIFLQKGLKTRHKNIYQKYYELLVSKIDDILLTTAFAADMEKINNLAGFNQLVEFYQQTLNLSPSQLNTLLMPYQQQYKNYFSDISPIPEEYQQGKMGLYKIYLLGSQTKHVDIYQNYYQFILNTITNSQLKKAFAADVKKSNTISELDQLVEFYRRTFKLSTSQLNKLLLPYQDHSKYGERVQEMLDATTEVHPQKNSGISWGKLLAGAAALLLQFRGIAGSKISLRGEHSDKDNYQLQSDCSPDKIHMECYLNNYYIAGDRLFPFFGDSSIESYFSTQPYLICRMTLSPPLTIPNDSRFFSDFFTPRRLPGDLSFLEKPPLVPFPDEVSGLDITLFGPLRRAGTFEFNLNGKAICKTDGTTVENNNTQIINIVGGELIANQHYLGNQPNQVFSHIRIIPDNFAAFGSVSVDNNTTQRLSVTAARDLTTTPECPQSVSVKNIQAALMLNDRQLTEINTDVTIKQPSLTLAPIQEQQFNPNTGVLQFTLPITTNSANINVTVDNHTIFRGNPRDFDGRFALSRASNDTTYRNITITPNCGSAKSVQVFVPAKPNATNSTSPTNTTSDNPPEAVNSSSSDPRLVIGLSAGGGAAVVVLALVACCLKRKGSTNTATGQDQNMEVEMDSTNHTPRPTTSTG